MPAPADAVRLDADLSGEELLRSIAAQPADEYALIDADGTFVGVLTREAIDAAYRSAR